MKTSEAMRGHEETILNFYGLQLTGNKHVECGICGGKKKLRIDIYKGELKYICVCGSGSIFKYLEESAGLEFKVVAAEIDELIGNAFESTVIETVESLGDKVLRKFKSLPELKGTDGQIYLNSRGIYILPRRGIRFNSHEGNYQSLYAIATDDLFSPVYLHRTLLDNGIKANVEVNKKMLTLKECFSSVSIKLFPIQSTLGIAEGIETALSCHTIYKCAVWSTLNTSLMKRFKAPNGVSHLMIFADNDRKGAGHAAAFECGHKNMLAKNDVNKVTIRWPKEIGDFNDMLLKGSEVYEWSFN